MSVVELFDVCNDSLMTVGTPDLTIIGGCWSMSPVCEAWGGVGDAGRKFYINRLPSVSMPWLRRGIIHLSRPPQQMLSLIRLESDGHEEGSHP